MIITRKGPDVTRASEASRPAGRYNAISLVANLIRTLGKSAGTNMLVYLPWANLIGTLGKCAKTQPMLYMLIHFEQI